MPKGGARPGAGQKGYGKNIAVREGVERLTPRWFAMIEEMLDAKPDEGLTDSVKELARELIARDSFHGKKLVEWLARGAIEDRKFALDQLGKLMGKLMPVEITGKNGKDLFPIPLLAKLTDVYNNDGDEKDSVAEKENKGGTGGNVGQQDGVDTLIPD